MGKRRKRSNLAGRRPLPQLRREDEWRDWPNLPTALVDDIADRLLSHDLAEYIRLRAACKEWRRCTADPREGRNQLDPRFRPRRWIMLSNRTDGDGRRFLNLSTGASARVDLPELSRHHLEASAEGLLLLRDKASHAVRLLNPLTRALTDLPPVTADLGNAYAVWTGPFQSAARIIYAGVSDETSPSSVVLLMADRHLGRAIAYANPGDQRWAVVDDEMWRPDQPLSCRFSSASTMRGCFYFATVEGYIIQVRLCPEPRLVPVVVDQPNTQYNMFCYLVPPDDHRCGGMLMVRYYLNLDHLSADEQRIMKRRRKVMDVIRVERHVKAQRWNLIQLFEVDVAGKRLVPVEDIGRHRAVFVGDVACFSLSARRFPCVAGNAVYMGARGARCPPVGVRYLADKTADPSFVFTTDVPGFLDCISMKQYREKIPELNLVPLARPCTLQEYLVCYAGLLGGLKD
ncbi:uncharacterized protein LOC125540936 [Triticum urartu]|uniref:uncharacterized protein LOC125540936 n=1 Tax=Triticum urartu TaxID=4572 RepID=UPI00204331E9|nr:uncharacterized protein LOC125540936 [Triticum urartu]